MIFFLWEFREYIKIIMLNKVLNIRIINLFKLEYFFIRNSKIMVFMDTSDIFDNFDHFLIVFLPYEWHNWDPIF